MRREADAACRAQAGLVYSLFLGWSAVRSDAASGSAGMWSPENTPQLVYARYSTIYGHGKHPKPEFLVSYKR